MHAAHPVLTPPHKLRTPLALVRLGEAKSAYLVNHTAAAHLRICLHFFLEHEIELANKRLDQPLLSLDSMQGICRMEQSCLGTVHAYAAAHNKRYDPPKSRVRRNVPGIGPSEPALCAQPRSAAGVRWILI